MIGFVHIYPHSFLTTWIHLLKSWSKPEVQSEAIKQKKTNSPIWGCTPDLDLISTIWQPTGPTSQCFITLNDNRLTLRIRFIFLKWHNRKTITGREVGRRVDNEEGEVREWHHRGRSYEERSKRQGRTKKIWKGESKGEWSVGLNNGVFIHLFLYSKNKETIHESGKQDL